MVDSFKILSSAALLVSGIVLAFLSFYTPPVGELSDSVLWYVGQCLIYSGTVCGVGVVIDYKLRSHEKH